MNIFKNLFMNSRDKRRIAKYKARDSYWESIGLVEDDVLAPIINPAFQGYPQWPDLRQAYKVIRTTNTIIIATDGLSDDFEDEDSGNGFGIELYVESNDEKLINMPMEQLNNTWLFQLLFQAACNAAQSGAYYNAIHTYGVVSSEFWDIDIDDRYMTENESVGVLVGIEHENRPSSMTFENDKILMVSVTAIKPEELNEIVVNGRAYRDQLAKMLQDQNRFNVIDLDRETL
ncbi:hypothetical protein FHR92_000644 [Fontibacillus solani]|uniref:Suppressor of fused-like domain-containing protein n=1 Tax=Fontibacillus solani TaxID=1572857 RepID=A0A7W3SQ46_9BACL|nr:suppressor of fused domain protein [Fontibacillus solani]MBA9084190.1 hypothetical protein [Fontibacillus solani]